MDARLVAWARAVKARRARGRGSFPVLWLFTDERRLADPRPSVARLPRGLAGVVLRHDGDPRRAELGRALARICRARRLALVVAGDVRLAAALGAGVHLRGGRWPGHARTRRGVLTSSAHGPAELRRAQRAGATPRLPVAGVPDTEPSCSQRPRAVALVEAGARHNHARRGLGRHRSFHGTTAAAAPVPRGRCHRRPHLEHFQPDWNRRLPCTLCHCEKRSDEAISRLTSAGGLSCGGLLRCCAPRNDRQYAAFSSQGGNGLAQRFHGTIPSGIVP